MFYDALVQIPSWQSLPLPVAAQAVQHSAYPGAYGQWEPQATALVAAFNGTAANCLTDNSNDGVPASGSTRLPSGSACRLSDVLDRERLAGARWHRSSTETPPSTRSPLTSLR
jgi:hypothetical protein